MTSPLVAWAITILVVSMSGVAWLISAPIVQALYSATASMVPEEAAASAMTLRLEFMILPIALDIGFVVWAFLVTTRRQAVVQGGWA